MRYRVGRSTKVRRGQVFTSVELAARLTQSVRTTGGNWLELGVGSGRLLEAAMSLGSVHQYVGVELDPRLAAKCPATSIAQVHIADVLEPDALKAALGDQRFSCVIGNPPFGIAEISLAAQARLKELYPHVRQIKAWGRLDLYFLLESLARLDRPGEAAFIVAAPIVHDPGLASFRKTLIENALEIECHELPPLTFDFRAEVQSFLLIARFGSTRGARVTLGRLAGRNFESVAARQVSQWAAIESMDLAHHEFRDFSMGLTQRPGFTTLEALGAKIVRGSRTRQQFEVLGIEHFHTSDFPLGSVDVRFSSDTSAGFQIAEVGNILVPRVGTRCIDRTAFVAKGRRPITEAVYRVIVPKRAQAAAFDWISGSEGKTWRRTAARGSCAKHLTVAALMKMPVPD